MKIFYADDDADDRFLFESAVRVINTPVALTCFSGGKKLESALLESGYGCDLVFLDLNMPGHTGLQTLDSLQNAIKVYSLKVVIFTTSAEIQVVQKAHDKNAVLFVQKPTDFDVLVNTLENIINTESTLKLPVLFRDFMFNLQECQSYSQL